MDNEVGEYDYAIIGGGLSGLLMAYRMVMDRRFAERTIVIFEDDQKKENDRTWCYWEEGEGEWDHILTQTWSTAKVKNKEGERSIPLESYRYKMLRSQDFYAFIECELQKHAHIIRSPRRVIKLIEDSDLVHIETADVKFKAKMVLSSVLGLHEKPIPNNEILLKQHFGGWFIRAEQAIFNPDEVVLMDFDVKQHDGVCFMYVLPLTVHSALVEFTVFGPSPWPMAAYEEQMRRYLAAFQTTYTIEEKEMGSIPMTVYPFEKNSTERILYIGTAGGWTRASTGYTFTNSCHFSKKLIDALACEQELPAVWAWRHRMYDSVMLALIAEHPQLGVDFFMRIYRNHPIARVFRFLDGSSSVFEEALIIGKSRPKMLLMHYVIQRLFRFRF